MHATPQAGEQLEQINSRRRPRGARPAKAADGIAAFEQARSKTASSTRAKGVTPRSMPTRRPREQAAPAAKPSTTSETATATTWS